MAWEFETDPHWQEQLDWVRDFVKTEVEPLTLLWPHLHHTPPPPWLKAVIDPLKEQVRARGLWACHLGPELGGKGYGQVKLALLNEILDARSGHRPSSAPRARIPAMRRSSPTTAPPSRSAATSNRC